MMQNVATAKSEVAAFAAQTKSNAFAGTESNEQFDSLMQQQKPAHSTTIRRESPPPHAPRKEKLSIDETKTYPSNREETKTKSTGPKTEKMYEEQTVKSSQHKDVIPQTADNTLDSHDTTDKQVISNQLPDNEALGDLNQTNTILNEVLLQSEVEVQPEIDAQPVDEEASVVAHKWVSLVEKLVGKPTLDHSSTAKNVEPIPADNKGKVIQSMDLYMQLALKQLPNQVESNDLSSLDTPEATAELLLEHPEVLQDLVNKMSAQNMVSKETDSISQSETAAADMIDLTTPEDQALLSSLLIDSKVAIDPAKQSVIQPQPELLETPEISINTQQLETLAEQDVHLEQQIPKELTTTAADKKSHSVDIKNILNLSENKQHKVLENIAARVFDNKPSNEGGELQTSVQMVQHSAAPKVAEILNSVDTPAKEFVAALKSGLEEFKTQLSQGREPGIDLKALVSDALAKSSDSNVNPKAPVNVEQVVSQVSQVLDFAQTMSRAIEHHHDQAYSVTARDAAQIQGEQSKHIQLNQFESKLDKTLNISKPEGHQQLAEKVRWMVNTKNLVADIRLDPAELGSMHVKVAVSGESATVNFVVQSQQARDAVDTATPKLREMLAEKGIELGQSSVREESAGQQQGDEPTGQSAAGHSEAEDINISEPEHVLAQQKVVNGALGGIDYFV
ncbi:flagellar hook-length control protein FliK [uncultured Paraglaciecola sp.]|uniref:flagellar hook-length control protein FliK n=1 Tax=uncultured Paraglaciecola sp. TaxID=1765024 RepID=UPI0026201E75|nr:flagellar hook-length control protein FliK [uncultured Paraglaciecola sp.]